MGERTKSRNPKKKKSKSVGIVRKGGKFFTCSICGAKRKTLQAMRRHYDEVGHPVKKRPKTNALSLSKLKAKGQARGISDAGFERAVILDRILNDPYEMREVVKQGIKDAIERRRRRGW